MKRTVCENIRISDPKGNLKIFSAWLSTLNSCRSHWDQAFAPFSSLLTLHHLFHRSVMRQHKLLVSSKNDVFQMFLCLWTLSADIFHYASGYLKLMLNSSLQQHGCSYLLHQKFYKYFRNLKFKKMILLYFDLTLTVTPIPGSMTDNCLFKWINCMIL